MAVEARHINPFPSLPIINRNLMMMKKNDNINIQEADLLGRPNSSYNSNLSSSHQQIRFMTDNNNYEHQPNINNHLAMMCTESQQLHNTKTTTESGLTYSNNIPMISRKRSRDDEYHNNNNNNVISTVPQYYTPSSNFLGDDFLPQLLQQHQYDVDTLISQHTKKIRLELAEKHKQQARSIASAVNEAMLKKLKEREEQIAKISKINLALQERVKSLCVENQLWREMAQTNEAAANSLRTNLEQMLLLHVSEDHHPPPNNEYDDVESCCGSTNDDEEIRNCNGYNSDVIRQRLQSCKMCGDRESCVLVLPCRHLCLCGVCGSGGSQTVEACPVCHSSMNGTLHVNTSSSS